MRRLVLLLGCAAMAHATGDYFQIRVVDDKTGRGVPLVELTTTNNISCWTDSNGVVAWNEPGLMDRDVHFTIKSPGYLFPGGGKTLKTTRGGSVALKMRRLDIAERLYRVTGQGIYRDSLLTGFPVPVREPALNSMVMGQDTVRAAVYRGALFWLWGDTSRPDGPLGNFNTTAATSRLPGKGGLDPSVGVELAYFTTPDGFVKQMIPWTKRMTWMHSLMTLRDPAGAERLVAYYEVIRSLGKPERAGLAVFHDKKREFDPLVEFPYVPRLLLEGHAIPVRAGGHDYFYFTGLRPGAGVRVPADWNAIQDLARYETLRAEGGFAVWKHGLRPDEQNALVHHTDFQTGESVTVECDGIAWNDYRRRWIATLQRRPGEVWYAEADSPSGPWVYAVRIIDHGKYTFYWPTPHPFFDQGDGRAVYLQGTYTDAFSGNPVITPRYNYNQIMYRISLDDERLFLPAPVYRLRDGRYLMREGVAAARAWDQVESIPFFALAPDRKRDGAVSVNGLFYAMPVELNASPASADGDWICTTDEETDFTVTLDSREGSSVVGLFGEQFRGRYEEGALKVEFELFGATMRVGGRYGEGKLSGRWEEAGRGAGTFTCTSAVSDSWRTSRALVPLYFYEGKYTTEARRGARPIARVWRNPTPELALDRAAAGER